MRRARLIQPFKVKYEQLDLSHQIDNQEFGFNEPELIDDGSQGGSMDIETSSILVPCSIYRRRPDTSTAQNNKEFSMAGTEMNSEMWLVHRLEDLDRLGLFDENKRVLIGLEARVNQIYSNKTEQLEYTFPEPFYVAHVDLVGAGLYSRNPSLNLIRVCIMNRKNFESRMDK